MSQQLLSYTMFDQVLFPKEKKSSSNKEISQLTLSKSIVYSPKVGLKIKEVPLTVFDLETTGLDSEQDHIIEIGAQKILAGKVIDEWSSFVETKRTLSLDIQNLTGISQEMLAGAPGIKETMKHFLQMIEGSILVAHNASFDYGFIVETCKNLQIELSWPAFCTLKLARELLPALERKNLDSLASHYGLSFESRHRSIGDVKVTVSVLENLLAAEGKNLQTWGDLEKFKVF